MNAIEDLWPKQKIEYFFNWKSLAKKMKNIVWNKKILQIMNSP